MTFEQMCKEADLGELDYEKLIELLSSRYNTSFITILNIIYDHMYPENYCECDICKELGRFRRNNFNSFNEVLLNIFMEEEHFKTWNGETFEVIK